MIRINLLGRARPRVKRPVEITGVLQLVLVLVPVGLAVLLLFIHYVRINADIAQLEENIRVKQQEKAQMAQLETEIAEFEKKDALLQGRIKVIEELRRNQAGPVRLLEAVGNTVSRTDTLWLTEMSEQSGNQIEFKGVAGSIAAVANFITNLNRSGYFQNVEMSETVQETRGGRNFEFVLTAKFALPAPPEDEKPEEGKS